MRSLKVFKFFRNLFLWSLEFLPALFLLLVIFICFGICLFTIPFTSLKEITAFTILLLLYQFDSYDFIFNVILVALSFLSLVFIIRNIKHRRFRKIKHPIGLLVILLTLLYVAFSSISGKQRFNELNQQLSIKMPSQAKLIAFCPSIVLVGSEDIYYIKVVMNEEDTRKFLADNMLPESYQTYSSPLDTGMPLGLFPSWYSKKLKGNIISGEKDCGSTGRLKYFIDVNGNKAVAYLMYWIA